MNVPIGVLDDVEIVFLHYKTENEAKQKWERRCKRINWDHILVKNSYMNCCSDDLMIKFDNLPYKNKLFFVGKDVSNVNCSIVYKANNNNFIEVSEDTIYFNRYFDLNEWINGSYDYSNGGDKVED